MMNQMMMDPFRGGMLGPQMFVNPRSMMIDDGAAAASRQRQAEVEMARQRQAQAQAEMARQMIPFGFAPPPALFAGGLLGGVGNMMHQMVGHLQLHCARPVVIGIRGFQENMQQQAMSDPNSHVYSHSTVGSVGAGQQGRPQFYESTNSVRKAGDVKEVERQ